VGCRAAAADDDDIFFYGTRNGNQYLVTGFIVQLYIAKSVHEMSRKRYF
jgi:hypothetical protein